MKFFYLNISVLTNIFGLASLVYCSIFSSIGLNTQKGNKLYTIETTDHVIVVKNNTVIFDYLEQANIKEPVQIQVIETPEFGEVKLDEHHSFGYTPDLNLCEKEDQFTYLMTTESQTIKVVVSIDILCESLTIFNGIALQEEDNKLEKFKILGVENYPNNELHIFDNEGKEIYQVQGYQNNWDGAVDSSEHLVTENLYYYVFNDGEGNYYSGYLIKN